MANHIQDFKKYTGELPQILRQVSKLFSLLWDS